MAYRDVVFVMQWMTYVSLSLSVVCPLLQEAEHWQRSVVKVAKIATALIRERSAALVGQVMQA